ncbi:hypothetical protein [Rhodococcus sp. SBT000017]|uniref:hypothetical protein n=2 Tax=unclassified Rhodococcus (in: high G+C Gram-positive bacteria) TaxID=192944 RepID=UPI0011C47203|nr:hypothetical protein [Rhodococcus sp. SBT000017]
MKRTPSAEEHPMKPFRRRRLELSTERPKLEQHAQRLRRRRWLPNVLRAEFSLSDEISAIVAPLTARIAHDPVPRAYAEMVDELADAVLGCVRELDHLTGNGDDQRRTAHLSEEDRRRALDLLRSHRAGQRPEITEADLASGAWAEALVELAAPVSGPLSDLLGRALPPEKVDVSVSESVEAALREVDRRALSLERRLDRRAADRELFHSTRPVPAPSVEDQLEELGVTS